MHAGRTFIRGHVKDKCPHVSIRNSATQIKVKMKQLDNATTPGASCAGDAIGEHAASRIKLPSRNLSQKTLQAYFLFELHFCLIYEKWALLNREMYLI